jgi:hypothetical protein
MKRHVELGEFMWREDRFDIEEVARLDSDVRFIHDGKLVKSGDCLAADLYEFVGCTYVVFRKG